MDFKYLAEKIIEAETEAAYKSLLKDVSAADLLKLARAVKEICYSFWTGEPIKAQISAIALQRLYRFSPQKEIKAYAQWIKGIAEITRGNLVSAIKSLDGSAAVFSTLENEHEAAQTQVAKLYALALLGQYPKAVETGIQALQVFEKHHDETAAGKIENNLGNIFIRQESLQEAKKYYLSAQSRFLKLENPEQLLLSEIGLANTYSLLNDFRQADLLYRRTLLDAQKTGMFLRQAEIETNIGKLALFRGKYDEALKFLENSRQDYKSLQMPHQSAIAELEIADIYLELNLTDEAVSIYEKVADELHKLKLQGEEAGARTNFGRVMAILNKPKAARQELKKAARLYVLEKNPVGAAVVKINEAKLELDLQNYRKTLKLTREAEIFLNQSENLRHQLIVFWLRAEALRKLGESEKARKLLTSVFAASIKQEQPQLAQSAQISLGKLALAEKDFKQAKNRFRHAIRLIEMLRAPLAAEEFRRAFLADKLVPYKHLAKIYVAENKLQEAFLMVEKARSRSLSENLGNVPATINNAQKPVSAKLLKELEVLREELNWFYSRLQRATEPESENLQREAKKREKEIADVLRQIAATDESKSGTRNFLDFKRLQNQLGEHQALIEFVNFDDLISAFVVTDKKISFVAGLVKESEIFALLKGLQFQFGSLRYGANILETFMPELKKRADFYLEKLYKKLLKPLEKVVGKRNLTIVPVGTLHSVPFHALFDGANYQIETREFIYAPSAAVWQFLAAQPHQKLSDALLMGFADERIPLVGREIESLQKIFPKSKSFTGAQATFAAFMENATRFDILHLACHGQFRPENPLFSSLHLADGFVTVRDVCKLKLKAEIVTLSACETGLNKLFAGDEILGLAGGFLSAGAKSLVLSLWTVNDETTTGLMKDFYTAIQTGKKASEALKIAQCNFIERGVHPYFWSPFALFGR